jgi:hypothetical protein
MRSRRRGERRSEVEEVTVNTSNAFQPAETSTALYFRKRLFFVLFHCFLFSLFSQNEYRTYVSSLFFVPPGGPDGSFLSSYCVSFSKQLVGETISMLVFWCFKKLTTLHFSEADGIRISVVIGFRYCKRTLYD